MAQEKQVKVIVTDIDWDVDVSDDADSLPQRMQYDVDADLTDDEIEDYVCEQLSDDTGFCHRSFEFHVIR